jgi:hypothetical protein
MPLSSEALQSPHPMESSMPADFIFYEDDGVAVLTLAGEMGDEDVMHAFAALSSDPRMRPEYNLLIDVRPLVAGPVSSAGIRELSALRSPLDPASRRAVLVSTDFGFGMSRMLNLNMPDEKLAYTIFRDESEARRYVGLPVE